MTSIRGNGWIVMETGTGCGAYKIFEEKKKINMQILSTKL